MKIPWKTILTVGISALAGSGKPKAVTAGTLLSMLVENIEHSKGSAPGQEKEDAVVLAFTSTLALAEGVSGKDLLDDAEYQNAVRQAIRAVVAVQNLIGKIGHAAAA